MARTGAELAQQLRVRPGSAVHLSKIDPGDTHGHDKEGAQPTLDEGKKRLNSLQERLFASKSGAILVVLQGMDTSGKDGAIKHVISAIDPQGAEVTSFGVPSPDERLHDYLWRHHGAAPRRGWVGIHNRSHYESVLVERVENLQPSKVWQKRYGQINDWEEELESAGTRVVKFFLFIDKDEQRRRLEARLADPSKQWKFNVDDLKTRDKWDDYMKAYEDALEKCSTDAAPWYVIPANRKWFRNLAVAEVLVNVLESMDVKFPDRTAELKDVVIS